MGRLVFLLVGFTWLVAPGSAQRPSAADTGILIEKSRQATLAYSASLPDFVCTEVVSRYRQNAGAVVTMGRGGFGAPAAVAAPPSWQPLDKLTVTLSYFQQREEHQLVQVNGKPTSLKYDSLVHGATSTGEFGSILKSVFESASQTSFSWERWKNERGRRIAVFAFQVPAATSHYYLENLAGGTVRRAAVGYHGTVEVDSETGQVIHFDYSADHIPRDLELSSTSTTVDYASTDIAGRGYLLPARSVMEMLSPTVGQKNETEFRGYEKFEASSSIDFGTSQ